MAKKQTLPKKKPEFVENPEQPKQLMRQLSPGTTEHKLKPEETLRQQGLARAAGNVPLPPETAAEKLLRPKPIITPEQMTALENKELEQDKITQAETLVQEQQPNLLKTLNQGLLSTNIAPGGLVGGAMGQTERLLTQPGEEAGRIATGVALGGAVAMGLGAIPKIPILLRLAGLPAVIGKITWAKRQAASVQANRFSNGKNNMNLVLASLNKYGANPVEAREVWNSQLADIRKSRVELKKLTQSSIDRFLSGGQQELEDVENFLSPEVQAMYELEFQKAVLTPNPNFNEAYIASQIQGVSE